MTASGHSRLLRILHIDPEKNWGGGEAQVIGLLTYLSERGHQNTLATHPQGQLFERSRKLNAKTIPLTVRNDLDWTPIPGLRRLIRKEKYDIVHLHTKRAHALALWLPRGVERPKYVVTRRMDYPEKKNWYNRYLYNRRVDGVVAISQPITALLVEAGVEPKKIRLIHSGIDPRPFAREAMATGTEEAEPVVGMVAVLEERKGHRFLLEAASLLKIQGHKIKYLLAGDGSLRSALEEKAVELNLKNEVHFLGFVSDMATFLSKVDIFVLPSLFEGLGVAALEAMAAGKAVVATRVGGLGDTVLDGVTGFLVPPRDSTGLAHALATLLRDPALARTMGQKGAQRVWQQFTVEQMARGNEAYYYDLLQGSS